MSEEVKRLDDFIKSSLDSILKQNGLIYTEQKFCSIFTTFENLAKTNVFKGTLTLDSRKVYYEYTFPNLAPRFKNIETVFDNSFNKNEKFKFHPSEKIYSNWIANYLSKEFPKDKCDNLIQEFNEWINWHKKIEAVQFKTIKDKILNDINLKEFDCTKYSPKDNEVKYYLNKNLPIGNKLKIADRHQLKINRVYILERQEKETFKITINPVVKVTAIEIENWLSKLGIDLSLTTCQFLLEFGFPYSGYLIKPQYLFQFSGNTTSVIGLLAYNLEKIKNGSNENALKESIILALSRLEYFHKI